MITSGYKIGVLFTTDRIKAVIPSVRFQNGIVAPRSMGFNVQFCSSFIILYFCIERLLKERVGCYVSQYACRIYSLCLCLSFL